MSREEATNLAIKYKHFWAKQWVSVCACVCVHIKTSWVVNNTLMAKATTFFHHNKTKQNNSVNLRGLVTRIHDQNLGSFEMGVPNQIKPNV